MSGLPEIKGGGTSVRTGSNLEGQTRNVVGMVIGPIAGFFGGLASINRFKLTAIFIWFIGVYATSLVVESATANGVSSAVSGLTVGWYANSFIGAFLAQYIFTTIEAPIFSGKKEANWLNVFILIIDVLINCVVVYPIANGIVYGPVWSFLEDATFKLTGNNLGNQDAISILLTILGGLVIAAGPEMLWKWGNTRKG